MQTLSRGSLRGRAGHSIILHHFVPDFVCKNCSEYFCTSHTIPSTIGRQKHALRQTQTSRTKACSHAHMIQVHMTSSSLWYFVFCEIPTRNSLPLSISGQDLYRRERTAWRSNVGVRWWLLVASHLQWWSSRHLTSTVYVLVCLYKSCPETDSGREFRVGITPKTK